MKLGKKYKRGYVQGTFDLFHVGHLNLLRRAKERCDYLIVGVVTDELNKIYKNRLPIIPYEDRAAIVEAIKFVDEVISVSPGHDDKLEIWEKCHFDCHFSGDDHMGWEALLQGLQKRGSNIEFFPYTQKVSSTIIRKNILEKSDYGLATDYPVDGLPERFALYGAGRLGQALYHRLKNMSEKTVVLWTDKEYRKLQDQGLMVASPEELLKIKEKVVIAVRSETVAQEIQEQLIEIGVAKDRIIR